MTGTRASGTSSDVAQHRQKSDSLFNLYHGLVLVFGGFLAGVLSHAVWVGAYDSIPAVIPFSCLFLVLVAGMIWWQRRRARE